MKILYFGTYDKKEGYPRNRLLLEGLRREGVEVMECHRELWNGNRDKLKELKKFSPLLILRIARTYASLLWRYLHCTGYDIMVVGYPGQLDIHLARILNLFRKKPILLDAFLSLYQTAVEDRQLLPRGTLRARLLKAIDCWACRTAFRVILDTHAHIRYFSRQFSLPEEKFIRVPVGAEDRIFLETTGPQGCENIQEMSQGKGFPVLEEMRGVPFPVLFFGTFLPLHGADVIVRAAYALRKEKDFRFFLVGNGPQWGAVYRLARRLKPGNLFFHRKWIPAPGIARMLRQSGASLGIFGGGEKSQMIVPCKVYSSLASGCAVITADTPAAREFLENGKTAVLVPPNDPVSLAEALFKLKSQPEKGEILRREGQKLFETRFLPQHLARALLDGLERANKFPPPSKTELRKSDPAGGMESSREGRKVAAGKGTEK